MKSEISEAAQGYQRTKEIHGLSGQARSVGEMDSKQCLQDERWLV